MAGVSNGQPVNAQTVNAAFLAKNGEDTCPGILNLANSDPASGPPIANLQKKVNETALKQKAHEELTEGMHGTSGGLVDTGSAQTIAAVKTLVAPLNLAPISEPDAPATAGHVSLYLDEQDGKVKRKGSDGKVELLGSGAGGGGGGSPIWYEAELSAVPKLEHNLKTYSFGAGYGLRLYRMLTVPESYTPGSQIKHFMPVFSAENSGKTIHLKTLTRLIKPGKGVDGTLVSAGPTYTSTNAAMEFDVSMADRIQWVEFDLTTADGKSGFGVDVEPGDVMLIRLFRDTDTSPEDVSAIVELSKESYNG